MSPSSLQVPNESVRLPDGYWALAPQLQLLFGISKGMCMIPGKFQDGFLQFIRQEKGRHVGWEGGELWGQRRVIVTLSSL